MSITQANNASPYSYEENYMMEEGQESFSFGEGDPGQVNSFGDQAQNVSRDEIVKLYRKVKEIHPVDEDHLLALLDEALDVLKDYKPENDAQALLDYEEVSQAMAGLIAQGEPAGETEGSNSEASGNSEESLEAESEDVEKEASSEEKEDGAQDYPESVQDLAAFTGNSEENIIAAVKSTFLIAPGNDGDFINWLNDEESFPPATPDSTVLQFLAKADSKIGETLKGLKGEDLTNPAVQGKVDQLMQRLKEDLNKLYPDASITMESFSESVVEMPITFFLPTISFNGTEYKIFNTIQADDGKFPGDFGANELIWEED